MFLVYLTISFICIGHIFEGGSDFGRIGPAVSDWRSPDGFRLGGFGLGGFGLGGFNLGGSYSTLKPAGNRLIGRVCRRAARRRTNKQTNLPKGTNKKF